MTPSGTPTRNLFKPARGVRAIWASYTTPSCEPAVDAFYAFASQLDDWRVPASNNRQMFSTWGRQWALLDGYVIQRDEPEERYVMPINGYVAGGPLVVQFVCLFGGLKPPRWAATSGTFGIEELKSMLVWQLHNELDALTARLELIRQVESIRELPVLNRQLLQQGGSLLPPPGVQLTSTVLPIPGTTPEEGDAVSLTFEERLLHSPMSTSLLRDASGLLHVVRNPACRAIEMPTSFVGAITVGDAADDLCDQCNSHFLAFLRDLSNPPSLASLALVTTRRLNFVVGSMHIDTQNLTHAIRFAVGDWEHVTDSTKITDRGMWLAPYGTVLETAVVPWHVGLAIERAIERLEAIGISPSLQIE